MRRTPLNRKQLGTLREALLQHRREITGDFRQVDDDQPGWSAGGGDMHTRLPTHPADEGTDEHGRATAKQLAQIERDLVYEIDEALRRMEDGTYGRCETCGKAIDLQRLTAQPWSRFCREHAPGAKPPRRPA